MTDAGPRSLSRHRNIILALLIVLAVAAWAMLAWQQAGMDMAMTTPTMGMRAPLFLTVWVVMMIAMMFPAAAPMILTFHQIQASKRARGESFVSTWAFAGGYLLVWALSGVLAFIAAAGAEALAMHVQLTEAAAARIGGGLLIVAGLYQFSPLKNICLARCRSPLAFIMTSWRDGTMGALRMGVTHGLFCLGCCWLLFLVLFPLGIMNIAAMAVLTLLVFAEKTLARGELIAKAAGIALVLYGTAVLAYPQALPTFTPMSGVNDMSGMKM